MYFTACPISLIYFFFVPAITEHSDPERETWAAWREGREMTSIPDPVIPENDFFPCCHHDAALF